VFVSSPGDVAEERLIAKRVLDRLAAEFAPRARIEPILWEHEPLLASSTFQTQIIRPAETDIVVCILWSRLGTRLSQQFKHPDGSPYNSGTEFEFEDALEGRKLRGAPDLLVYRKTAEPVVSLKDTRAASQALTQKMLLDDFVQRFFHSEDGTLTAAFHPFEHTADFETRLEDHLRKLIEERLRALGISGGDRGPVVRPTWTGESPFRGLQVFEFEHHAIFFGRTRAIGEILERLKQQAAEGRAFLLVLGVSGSGKSSLVRAGVLPDLVEPGVVEGVGLWRRAIFRPGERSGDLFDGLAAALRREEALPELASDGTTVEQLAHMLRSNPEAAPYLIKGALAQAASYLVKAESSPVQPAARLVLVLDQLEELFTAGDLSQEHRTAFLRAISALAGSGQTWVIATLRSDFYHRCAELPALVDLKSGSGQYDVQPPDASEIAQLVRRPTLAAGLQFEPEDSQTGERLDDLLRDAAAANRDSLPLLEFTLDELYRRRSGSVLTLQAYRELGGMEGALARRADEVFAGLPEAARSALPYVFRQLVTIGGDDDETPTRKQAPMALLDAPQSGGGAALEAGSGTSPPRQLVDAFVAARLLTAKQTDDGTPVVEVTHEALLSRWQLLVDWLREDRELLRIRGRVAAEAARWVQEGRRADLLLQTGKPLDEGLQLQSAGFPLNAAESEFIANSLAAARRRARLRRSTIAALCVLTVVALAGALLASVMGVRATANARRADENAAAANANAERADENARKAESETKEAVKAKTLAETQLLRARTAEYTVKIGVAQRDLAEGNVTHAEDLLSGCAWDLRGWEHRYLWTSVAKRRAVLLGHADSVASAAFSPDGRRIVSGSADKTLKVWDAATGQETLTLKGHAAPVHSVAFSPDGRRIVSGSADKTLRLWDAATGQDSLTLKGHTAAVHSVAFSPDSRRIVSGSWDKTLVVWDAATGQETLTLKGHTGDVMSVAFSPDGRRIVSGSDDKTLKVWDAATGQETLTLKGHTGDVMSVAFSPDGRRIVSGSADRTLEVWDAAIEQEPLTLNGHTREVASAAFSPDGRRIVSGSADKTLKVWDAATGQETLTLKGHTREVTSAAFSPDGRRIVSGSLGLDGTLKVWDAATGRETLTLQGHAAPVQSVAFSPDGRWIVSGSGDKTLKVWDAATGREPLTLKGHAAPVQSVAFSPDGRRIVSGSGDKTLKVWDAATGQATLTLTGHIEPVLSVAFSPDGRRIVSGSADGTLKVWDAATGRETFTLKGHTAPVQSVAFSPDGRRIISGSADGTLKVWDAATGQETLTLNGHTAPVQSVAFSPDGRRIVSGGTDHTLKVWDATADQGALTLKGHTDSVASAVFSPDCRQIVSGSADGTLKVWDAATGQETLTLRGHTNAVTSAAFSPDCRQTVSGSADGMLKVWDAATGQETRTLKGHANVVTSVAFSPDGRRIVSGSYDNTLKVWDAATGQETRTLKGHANAVESVAFSPDGRRIVSGSYDNTLKVWDAATGQETRTLKGHTGEVMSVAFSPDGRRIVSGSADGTLKVWDAATGQEVRTLKGHTKVVWSAAFSPDGRRIVSGSDDNTLKVWDAAPGREMQNSRADGSSP
jgi:WD40 repeat protein